MVRQIDRRHRSRGRVVVDRQPRPLQPNRRGCCDFAREALIACRAGQRQLDNATITVNVGLALPPSAMEAPGAAVELVLAFVRRQLVDCAVKLESRVRYPIRPPTNGSTVIGNRSGVIVNRNLLVAAIMSNGDRM